MEKLRPLIGDKIALAFQTGWLNCALSGRAGVCHKMLSDKALWAEPILQ
jgi:hypothetical protein